MYSLGEVDKTFWKLGSLVIPLTEKGPYVMVDKIMTQDETSTSQNMLLTSEIGDLAARSRRQTC